MKSFFFYLLEVVFCSGIFYLFYLLALRNALFHQWNRFFLLSAVVLSVFLPAIQFTILITDGNANDAWQLLLLLHAAQQGAVHTGSLNESNAFWQNVLLIIYSSSSLVLAMRFAVPLFRLRKLARGAGVPLTKNIRLVETTAPGAPFSFFTTIFWNPNISLHSATGKQILAHEMVHIVERHSLDKLVFLLVQSVFWINPFFWWMQRELSVIHEFIADKKSVGANGEALFASSLLIAAFPNHYRNIVNPFFHNEIKRRVRMLTKKQNDALHYAGRLAALPVLALTAMAFTIQLEKEKGVTQQPLYAATTLLPLTDTTPRSTKDIKRVDVDKKMNRVAITYKDGTVAYPTEADLKKMSEKDATQKKREARETKEKKADNNPLYILNGEVYKGNINSIDPATIESVNVLKGGDAVTKYGNKGKQGVVEITLKKQ